MEEFDGSGVHAGWDASIVFASDELGIDPPDFVDEPSPPGKRSDPDEDLPSLPKFDSPSPAPIRKVEETDAPSSAQATELTGATHLVSVEPEPGEDVGAGMSSTTLPLVPSEPTATSASTATGCVGMTGTSPKPLVPDPVSEAIERKAVEELAAAAQALSMQVAAMEALVPETESDDDRGLVRDVRAIDPVCGSRETLRAHRCRI